jgi:hypothetical protein
MGNLPVEYGPLQRRWRQPWGWKFLTLTIPHGAEERARLRETGETEDGMEQDTRDLATRIWPKFWRWIKTHLDKDRGEELAPLFVKCLEMTVEETKAGREQEDQANGHAHYHVAVFAPFLHKNIINLYWSKALATCGRTCPSVSVEDVLAGTVPGSASTHEFYREDVARCFVTRRGSCGRPLSATYEDWQPEEGHIPWAVTDIREAYGDVSHELVKYLVKDVNVKTGRRVRSLEFARVYRAIEGRRRLTTSKAFKMPDPEPCRCENCKGELVEVDTETGEVNPSWTMRCLQPPDTPGQIKTEPVRDIVRDGMQRELVAQLRLWERERRVYQMELRL